MADELNIMVHVMDSVLKSRPAVARPRPRPKVRRPRPRPRPQVSRPRPEQLLCLRLLKTISNENVLLMYADDANLVVSQKSGRKSFWGSGLF